MKSFALEPDLPVPESFKERLPLIAKEIKPALIWASGFRGEEDYKFERCEVALYAFSPETAAKIIKSVIRDAVNREISTIGRIPFEIDENYLILGNKEITGIKKAWEKFRGYRNVKKSYNHVEHCLFQTAFVDFTALEQLQSLIPRDNDEISWDFDIFFKKLNASEWDEVMEMISNANDTEMWKLIWFISMYPKDIPGRVLLKIKGLFKHPEKYARGFALKIAFLSEDMDLITTFINSTWSYSNKNDNEENYWGSLIIAKFGIMLPLSCINKSKLV